MGKKKDEGRRGEEENVERSWTDEGGRSGGWKCRRRRRWHRRGWRRVVGVVDEAGKRGEK